MKPRTIVAGLVLVVMAAVCVRLGFWQLARLAQKRHENAVVRAAFAAPPIVYGVTAAPAESLIGRRVVARGRFDETRQVLLAGRPHAGSPGVEVVTPLVLADGRRAVLVNRGWLYSDDAATARPQESPEPGAREVLGLARALGPADRAPWRTIESDSVTLWSALALDPDSAAARLPYALAPFVLRALPGPGAPEKPVRSLPEPANETMHLSYAVQWFFFAALLLFGPAAVALSRRRRPPGDVADPDLSLRR